MFYFSGYNGPLSVSSLSQECQWQNSRFCCAPCRAVLTAEEAQLKASSEASREAEEAYSRACHEMQGGSDFLQAHQALQACKAQLLQVRQSVPVLAQRSPAAVAPLFPAIPLLQHCRFGTLHGHVPPRALQHRNEVGRALGAFAVTTVEDARAGGGSAQASRARAEEGAIPEGGCADGTS